MPTQTKQIGIAMNYGNSGILNLTQHTATAEQVATGVIDLNAEQGARLRALLTFNDMPSRDDLIARAREVAVLAYGCSPTGEQPRSTNYGGAPYLMFFWMML